MCALVSACFSRAVTKTIRRMVMQRGRNVEENKHVLRKSVSILGLRSSALNLVDRQIEWLSTSGGLVSKNDVYMSACTYFSRMLIKKFEKSVLQQETRESSVDGVRDEYERKTLHKVAPGA